MDDQQPAPSPPADRLAAELDSLAGLDLAQLRVQHRNLFGRIAPARVSRSLLLHVLAYRIQAEAFGDLGRDCRNTTSRRLTLNVLLSFAQFEREVTGERIREKIAASNWKGIWVGGVVPMGYRVEDRKLVVDEGEAALVQHVFERYLVLGSLPAPQRGASRTKHRHPTTNPVLGSDRRWGGLDQRSPCSPAAQPHVRTSVSLTIASRVSRANTRRSLIATSSRPCKPSSMATFSSAGKAEVRHAANGPVLRRSRPPHEPDPCDQEGAALPLLCLDHAGAGPQGRGRLHAPASAPKLEAMVCEAIGIQATS